MGRTQWCRVILTHSRSDQVSGTPGVGCGPRAPARLRRPHPDRAEWKLLRVTVRHVEEVRLWGRDEVGGAEEAARGSAAEGPEPDEGTPRARRWPRSTAPATVATAVVAPREAGSGEEAQARLALRQLPVELSETQVVAAVEADDVEESPLSAVGA